MNLSPETKRGTGIDTVPAGPANADRPARMAMCLERARSGDMAALDQAVRELSPLLWHVARSQGLSAEDAADVVQTTWLELVRQLNVIRSPQTLIAWLVRVTRRESWRVNTRQHRDPAREALGETVDPWPELEERLETGERHRVLWHHFQRLSESCRVLLRIIALTDRPDYEAVAKALKMPRGSIGPTRGRCLSKLRAMLVADSTWSAR
ncbi:MAG TPA: sigma-70 family RNA polymerase sigma factor [Candidatus Limnocylindrales bacterium]|nr:sigma-70 family RNA polymerase sigma factor [Candidatus Limnocylindrales bacterium]